MANLWSSDLLLPGYFPHRHFEFREDPGDEVAVDTLSATMFDAPSR